jgi:hypothetical protein
MEHDMNFLWSLLLAQAPAMPALPSGPWLLSKKGHGCQVAWYFDNESRIAAGLESAVNTRTRTMFFVAPKGSLPTGIGELDLTLDGKEPMRLHYGSFDMADPKLRMIKTFPGKVELERLSNAATIALGKQAYAFQGSEVGKALSALDRCTVDQIASWGVDPALYLNDKMATMGNVGQWFSADAYPKEARATRASGMVVLLITSKADGSVEACKAVASAHESLNAGSCAIVLKHIKLVPPVDDAGQPMASYAILPIRWSAP